MGRNLQGFWHPHGRGPRLSECKAKPAREKKKKYTKLKLTLVTSQLTEAALTLTLHPCTVGELARYLATHHPQDAKTLIGDLRMAMADFSHAE